MLLIRAHHNPLSSIQHNCFASSCLFPFVSLFVSAILLLPSSFLFCLSSFFIIISLPALFSLLFLPLFTILPSPAHVLFVYLWHCTNLFLYCRLSFVTSPCLLTILPLPVSSFCLSPFCLSTSLLFFASPNNSLLRCLSLPLSYFASPYLFTTLPLLVSFLFAPLPVFLSLCLFSLSSVSTSLYYAAAAPL